MAGNAKKKSENNSVMLMLILILSGLLLASVVYIVVVKYHDYSDKQLEEAVMAGYRQGVVDSVRTLYEETAKCKPVPVIFYNETRQVIDAGCIAPAGE